MWRRFSLLTIVVSLVCLFADSANAQQVKFVEKETKAFFESSAASERLQVVFPVESSAKTAAKIKLEILNIDDSVLAQAETTENLRRGNQTLKIPLAFAQPQNDSVALLWYRLRYSVTPQSDSLPLTGIISLSEILPEIFEIRAVSAKNVYAGMKYRVRVRAFHPVTNRPTPGVKITAEIKLDIDTEEDEDELKLAAKAVTDREGYAVLDFKIPEGVKLDYDGDLEIKGEKNGIVREAEQDLNNLEAENSYYLNTDKPIYQPNQNFYVRALAVNNSGFSKKTLADRELKFIVEDEDDTVLYRETVKTSRFGIASIAWKIPENAKLGTYHVRLEDDADNDGRRGYMEFKVSRYDLPNFTVTAKPDRTFYLPGQNLAEITISANYLFGKPVAKGKVRVVREKERRWNYSEQKYEVEEEKSYDGDTNAEGKFIAKVDLSEAHQILKDNEYRRFEDVKFAAYFTDSTTNRTEQRRFDVRVTREAIHVYAIGLGGQDRSPKLPVRFYVSTFYADGAPAVCDVEIKGKFEKEDEKQTRSLTRLKTNRFGAGEVEFVVPNSEDYSQDLQLKLIASDEKNQKGTHEEEIDLDEDEKQILVRTAKAIYRAGEPVDLEIFSTESEQDVFVDVVKDWSVVDSRLIRIKKGRASVQIPYKADFKGELTVAAYIDDDGEGAVRDAKGIIFPTPTGLRLNAESAKTVYRPGEEAQVNFNLISLDKQQKPTGNAAALGVVVFDKAIDERAKTDAEFGDSRAGNAFGDFASLVRDDKSFGGITVSLLNNLDLRAKIPEDLQLAAEALLANANYYPEFFESDEYGSNQLIIFKHYFDAQIEPMQKILNEVYAKDFTHPTSEAELQSILSARGIDFKNLRDPWGMPYRAEFSVLWGEDVFSIRSAGADKVFDKRHDFVVLTMRFKYFTPIGNAIDRAAAEYHKRTGAFIRDYTTLRDEVRKQNVDLDAIRDRWNRPYIFEFGLSERFYLIDVKTLNADGKKYEGVGVGDDFSVWTNRTDYFVETEGKMQAILSNFAREKKSFPKDENEFREILRGGGIDFDALRDGFNHPIYLEFGSYSRYSDSVKTEVVSNYGEAGKARTTITPVTQQVAIIRVRSAGADNILGNADDFNLTTFSGVISEQAKDDAKPREIKTETIFTGGKGAIQGTITDVQGAIVPNTEVTATNEETNQSFTTKSNDEGFYLIGNLPAGKYSVKTGGMAGFMASVVQNVLVRASTMTELNIQLYAATANAEVTVTAGSEVTIETTSSSVGTNVTSQEIQSLPINGRKLSNLYLKKPMNVTVVEENSTPRLREYFPETVFWQPEIVTDKNGRAQIKFKLGDNITTWKVYAIASTLEGKIGLAEQEIQAFQPFFVDLEPPKILTEGDEINLPVQIRNYTDAAKKVSVTMANGDWFSFLNQPNQKIEVAANATENAIFGFRAEKSVKEGKQRVTALADKDSDAIEKPIGVHPNGKEVVRTESQIFRDSVAFDVNFPANALPNTPQAEIKIYPNLLAHVAESVEGILSRPYGCGEQTLSSTYPNVMILKVLKNSPDSKLKTQALKYLQQGYEKLLGYQKAEGGFAVWTKDAPDAALTAYALRFLSDAGEFIETDEDAVERAQKWLLSQQRADGSWTKQYSWEKTEDRQRTKMISTYIVRSLAMTERDKKEKSKEVAAALQKAFEYLKTRSEEIDEPYALANLGLAALDAGNAATAQAIAAKLEKMAIGEGSERVYWNLETNTPFYGWGFAGRIETTALVTQLLQREAQANQRENVTRDNLISKATMFLLKNKDRYGVWYSTQATINVLDAILAVVGDVSVLSGNLQPRTAEIFVNNQKVKSVVLPPENQLAYPVVVNLSESLTTPNNRVEVKINGNSATAAATMAQTIARHYISWQDFIASETEGRNTNQSRQLRLDYNCDKLQAKPTEEITCAVEAERIGFRGYGMLLAEIGIPPGAEVDRASLEKAKEDVWSFSRYDVLPDKIIVYMWANPGGTKFNFKFKPRYGINALTAPSVIYDYYNEEARATLAPLRFSVK